MQLTSNVNGDIFMRGKKIRVKKGMPDSIAVVDTIAALYDLNAKAAQKKWNRLLGDHPEVGDKTVSVRFSSRSGTSTPAAGINNLVYIISKLKGPVAEFFAKKGADSWTRILGGDQSLHAEVDACLAEQNRLAVEDPSNPMRAFGFYVENMTTESAVLLWKEKRGKQKQETKHLADEIRNKGHGKPQVYATVNNYKNQAIFGFNGTTAAFKKENAIRSSEPMAELMTPMQLDLDSMMGYKIATSIKEANSLTQTQLFSKARNVRDKTAEFARYIGIQGLNGERFGSSVRELDREERRENKRLRLLEKKKQLVIEQKANNPILKLFAKCFVVTA